MKLPTLYGKSSSGKLLLWEVFTLQDKITVRHGQLGSNKIQEKETFATPKNVGKANETTSSQQADIEALAKWTKQKKKGYYETKEEAIGHIEWHPMKLQDFKDQGHKIEYPCYIQPKFDGMRCMVDRDGKIISKQGESLTFPPQIREDIDKIIQYQADSFKGLDGEIYSGLAQQGGLSLQQIISAFRKENENTPKLKYYIYNIPNPNEEFEDRQQRLMDLQTIVSSLSLHNVVVVPGLFCLGEKDMKYKHSVNVDRGYEGSVVHNLKGLYEFGKRSYDSQKLKPRDTTEAYVILVEKDKNQQGVLHCELENGVQFKCLMRKDASEVINLREYNNSLTLVGKWITVEFESYSDAGVPGKPTGIAVRDVNSLTWEGK